MVELRVIWKEKKLDSPRMWRVMLALFSSYGPPRIPVSNSIAQTSKSLEEISRTVLVSAWMVVCALTADANAEKDILETSARSKNSYQIKLTTRNTLSTSCSSSWWYWLLSLSSSARGFFSKMQAKSWDQQKNWLHQERKKELFEPTAIITSRLELIYV